MNNCVLEDLQCKGLMIYQSKDGYRFTSDAVALANFVTVKNGGVLVDLCSGSGVIGILANAKNRIKQVYLVELQPSLADMCRQTVEYNKIKNITIINRQLQGVHKLLINTNIDTVVCNPPYYKKESKTRAKTKEISVARNELEVSLEEVISEASKLLKDGGKFYMCHKMSRLTDIIVYLRKHNLEPKELKILPDCKNDETILVKAIKKGEVGLKLA